VQLVVADGQDLVEYVLYRLMTSVKAEASVAVRFLDQGDELGLGRH
jgi:hypothetical protein